MKNKVSRHELLLIIYLALTTIEISILCGLTFFPHPRPLHLQYSSNLYSTKQIVSISCTIYIFKATITKIHIVISELITSTVQSFPSIHDIKRDSTIEWNEPIFIYTCIINQYFLSSIDKYLYYSVPSTKLFCNSPLYK
jgi:hypothetical protein